MWSFLFSFTGWFGLRKTVGFVAKVSYICIMEMCLLGSNASLGEIVVTWKKTTFGKDHDVS